MYLIMLIYFLSVWPVVGVILLAMYYGFAEPFYDLKGKNKHVAKAVFLAYWLLHPWIFYLIVGNSFSDLLGLIPKVFFKFIWLISGKSHEGSLLIFLVLISIFLALFIGLIWYLWEFFWPSSRPLLKLSAYSVSEKERMLEELKQLRLQNKISAKEYLSKIDEVLEN